MQGNGFNVIFGKWKKWEKLGIYYCFWQSPFFQMGGVCLFKYVVASVRWLCILMEKSEEKIDKQDKMGDFSRTVLVRLPLRPLFAGNNN